MHTSKQTFPSLLQYLSSANLTTNEDIKGSYSSKRTHTNFNPFSAGNLFANCNEVLCSPLNPSLIDATGLVTEQYMAERKLSQLQADLQQQVPAGQIGVLMQPPRPGGNNPPESNFAAYPRQPRTQGINDTNVAADNFDKGETKLNYSNVERTGSDGRSIMYLIVLELLGECSPSPRVPAPLLSNAM